MPHKSKSKYLAVISLAVMACGFICTLPFRRYSAAAILQGGFEAGLVGGLADWFAVTALFRHPLGIPIPHTALLPQNRQRLIGALVKVLENDWLTKESIKNKLNQVNLFEKFIQVLERELFSQSVKTWIISELNPFISGISIESLAPHIEGEIKAYIKNTDIKPLLLGVKAYAWEKRLPQDTFDFIIAEAEKWAEKDEAKTAVGSTVMKLMNGIETEGFLKLALGGFRMFLRENRLGEMLLPVIRSKLGELKTDENEIRRMVLDELGGKIDGVIESDELMGRVNNWKNEAADNLSLSEKIIEILNQQKDRLASMLQDEEVIGQVIFPGIRNFIGNLLAVPDKIEKIEAWIHQMIYEIVDANHSKIGKLVKENLDKPDDKTLVNMMENNLGGDLQWIRVNGAVCGFLIGIALTLIKLII